MAVTLRGFQVRLEKAMQFLPSFLVIFTMGAYQVEEQHRDQIERCPKNRAVLVPS